jgi:subtilisin family serine protease
VKKWVVAAVATLVMLALVGPVDPASAQDPGADPSSALQTADVVERGVAESPTGSYIVVMVDDPLVASVPADELDTAGAVAAADDLDATHDDVLAEAGVSPTDKVQDFTNALNGFSALLSHEEALAVAASPKVAMVVPDELQQPTTDASPRFLGLTGRGGAFASGLTGEGVVVGVIDSGIWPEHPSFADDGTYPPPPITLDDSERSACEFGNTAHNPADLPFTCNNKLIGARQMMDTYRAVIGADPDEFDSARDDDGHGTHTASTAAGNAGVEASIFGRDYGRISGIAPRAHIVAYKGLGNLGGFTSDLVSAIDQAVADGVDVINYSIGGGPNLGSPDGISFLFAADAGVWVATSAGNDGPDPATIGGPADLPWVTSVGAATQRRFFEGTLELTSTRRPLAAGANFGNFWHRIKVTYDGASVTPDMPTRVPIVDAEDAGGDLCLRDTLDPAIVTGAVVLCRRGAIGRAEKSLAVKEAGGVGMVLYNNTDSDNLFSDNHWVPSVHVDYTPGLEIKEFIATTPNPMARIRSGKVTKISYAPSATYFSSRGPNPSAADVIKPDVTAPGLQILAGNSPYPDPDSTPGGELFQAIAGTSMSSPHVAGLFALLHQAHPDWSAAMARSAIMTSADPDVRDDDRVSLAGPFEVGSGLIDPGRPSSHGSAFDPGLVYDAGLFEYAAFTCGAEAGIFTTGSCDFLAGLGIPTDGSDLNYPSIGVAELAGTQTVTRTVTSVASRTLWWRATVDAPPGYDVTVSPRSMWLAPGESATYEVTITNTGSAPAGEWRFGSLTWSSFGGYRARSPIAVNGALIGAPDEVNGTGTDGTLSFDVAFGYDGAYTAAPHGLVPEVLLPGTVSQDPDQTYPSADDGAGVVKIPIELTGAALLRLELVIDGEADIDLFLEDSSGNIVADSTSGGTDEHIDLVLPPDDTYTLVVHGWSVPPTLDPLDFAVSSWIVPLASGGSLSVDSAPTEATTATTATIDLSWAGLEPDTRYLGAVSHSDAGGVLDLTIVGVES